MKKTKLNKAHHVLKGKMIDFFGWELPVQYSGLSDEHLAVRTKGGLFDVSHMGEIFFTGKEALEAVQYITSNNVAKLAPGKIHYSGLLTEKGCFVDDLLVYMMAENRYMLVVNAANRAKDLQWMQEKAGHFDVAIEDRSDEYTQIAIQGPNCEKLLGRFCDIDLAAISYYRFVEGRVKGIDAIISRTGYTGEDGFEIYFISDEDAACDLFIALAQEGQDLGFVPAGLGARDTLRLEAKMALYGNDIDDSHTVLEADLGWILKLKKGDFIGKEPLVMQKKEGVQKKLIGFEMVDKGIARHGYPVYIGDNQFGTVTSGTYAPFLKKAIGLTYLPIDLCTVGSEFAVEIRGKKATAKVVETPFYKREKHSDAYKTNRFHGYDKKK